jgi:hypothetical protein
MPDPAQRSNRRLTARVACQLTVGYRSGVIAAGTAPEDGPQWHPATAMDVSRNGCRLRLGEDLERGSDISVRIEHPGRSGSSALEAEMTGMVIWSRREGLSYQAGVQFSIEPDGLHEILQTLA